VFVAAAIAAAGAVMALVLIPTQPPAVSAVGAVVSRQPAVAEGGAG
jgi:hypothetical protein